MRPKDKVRQRKVRENMRLALVELETVTRRGLNRSKSKNKSHFLTEDPRYYSVLCKYSAAKKTASKHGGRRK